MHLRDLVLQLNALQRLGAGSLHQSQQTRALWPTMCFIEHCHIHVLGMIHFHGATTELGSCTTNHMAYKISNKYSLPFTEKLIDPQIRNVGKKNLGETALIYTLLAGSAFGEMLVACHGWYFFKCSAKEKALVVKRGDS